MFIDALIDGVIVFFLSMTPLGELRLGIPYGMAVFKLDALPAFAWGVLGNIAIAAVLIRFLDPTVTWIFSHSPFLSKHIKKYFEKLHQKHNESFNRRGAIFLTLFVALPIPGTGAWAGSALAYIFNIPKRMALPAISFGIAIAGFLVTFSTASIFAVISALQA